MKTQSVKTTINDVEASQHSSETELKKRKEFEVEVSEQLRKKYDALLQPVNLSDASDKTLEENKLPAGYTLLVNLYKDQEFMNEVRWNGDAAINGYLYEKYPDVVQYLRENKLRIFSEIVGKTRMEVAIESASSKAGSETRACAESKSEVVASARSEATQRAGRESESRAAVAVREEAMACFHRESKGIQANNFSIWSRRSAKEIALRENASTEVGTYTRSDVRTNEDVNIWSISATRVTTQDDVNVDYKINGKGQGNKTFSVWSRKPAKVTV